MSQHNDLRQFVNSLPDSESAEQLQQRLVSVGIEANLHAVPAEAVSDTFRVAMSFLLDKPLGELSTDVIRSLTAEVRAVSAALTTETTANAILQGYKKHEFGVVEISLPAGVSVIEAGKALNVAAEKRGLPNLVFDEGDCEIWDNIEKLHYAQTKPGMTYQFVIQGQGYDKGRKEQIVEYGDGAPLGAVALAEACERLRTLNAGSLLRDRSGRSIGVRGAGSGRAVWPSNEFGVGVIAFRDSTPSADVSYATLVSKD